MITDIVEDVDRGLLWIGTKEGLYSIFNNRDSLLLQSDFLNRNLTVNGIELVDSVLWMSSNSGLLKYDTLRNENWSFSLADGQQGDEYNFNASLKLSSRHSLCGSAFGVPCSVMTKMLSYCWFVGVCIN